MKPIGVLKVHRSSTRLVVMAVLGIAAAVLTGLSGDWALAPIAGWGVACITYVAWVWLTIAPMDATTTAGHATREDPSRGVADLLIVLTSLASLGAVAFLLLVTQTTAGQQGIQAGVAVLSVALSWVLLHTLFTLRYASLYYSGVDGGIEFNQTAPPDYGDFAYLAFTLGMTFQVSDTNIEDHSIRMTALRHSLLSYLFGSVILATLINLVAGLLR